MSPPPLWPPQLPQTSTISGYGDSIPDGRVLTKQTTGIGKRRAFWNGLRMVNISMVMNAGQWGVLNSFWNTTLNKGVLPFWMLDVMLHNRPIAVDSTLNPVLANDTQTVNVSAYSLCQFGEKAPNIQETSADDIFMITMAIEVLPV